MSKELPGRHRKPARKGKSHPTAIADAIQDLVQKLGIGRTMNQFQVITSWDSIVGEQIARVARAERLENGILHVAVATAPWRTELSMKRRQIIDRINAAVGEAIVKDIRFR